jgi:hypothetical protein
VGAKTKPAVTCISERVWHSQQNWFYERIEKLAGPAQHRARYKVKINPYDFQSRATVELWDGTEWREVDRIPGEQLGGPEYSDLQYGGLKVGPREFESWLLRLRAVLLAVVD